MLHDEVGPSYSCFKVRRFYYFVFPRAVQRKSGQLFLHSRARDRLSLHQMDRTLSRHSIDTLVELKSLPSILYRQNEISRRMLRASPHPLRFHDRGSKCYVHAPRARHVHMYQASTNTSFRSVATNSIHFLQRVSQVAAIADALIV